MSYIYGAAVQGIQQFIFQTNELKDIVGASALVESICTDMFENQFKKEGVEYDAQRSIIKAAGNIKYEFETREECERIFRVFPKVVTESAPGITISQAVVEYGEGDNYVEAINELERRLRVQRNRPMASTTIGLMGIMRSRKTNLPVVEIETTRKGAVEYLDQGTLCKRKAAKMLGLCHKAFGDKSLRYEDVVIDPDKMTRKNNWIAVIHADGNGLGRIVQEIGTYREAFKEFSIELDNATKEAAVKAYHKLLEEKLIDASSPIPIRPIVLGGDDFTVICRADLALQYARSFMENFEAETRSRLAGYINGSKTGKAVFSEGDLQDCLTACAGIAYVKSSYPFYYAYELAESLCTLAKKDAKDKDSIREGKEIAPSCLMFHKVQDSFMEDFDEIRKRELCTKSGKRLDHGPYYLRRCEHRPKKWTIEKLAAMSDLLEKKEKDGNAVKSNLRNWLTLLNDNPGMAAQKLKRMKKLITDKELLELVDEATKEDCVPAYDILAIHTINTQQTKEDPEK